MTSVTTKGTILDRIVETKRAEVAALKATRSGTAREMIERCQDLPPTRGFRKALAVTLSPPSPLPHAVGEGGEREAEWESALATGSSIPPSPTAWGRGQGGEGSERASTSVALIAEVKKASPSKGVIRADFDPVAIARAYERGGASCLSVLTDEQYFQGSLSYLTAIREAIALPLLRKDFLIDPVQIYEARLAGADAILLIVACIPSPARLAEMRHVAESLGLDALVEVHDAAELEIAAESGATLIGVNNRNLHTFSVSLETTAELVPRFPAGSLAVAESGIFTPVDVAAVRAAGAQAILVGESLMRADDIEAATRALLATA